MSRDPSQAVLSRVVDRESARLDRARPGNLGEAARRRGLVAAQEHAVATVDRRAVTPREPRQVERAAAAVHDLAATPGHAVAPALEGRVEQLLEARGRVDGGLLRAD